MDSLNPLLGWGDFRMGHDYIGLDCQATLTGDDRSNSSSPSRMIFSIAAGS